VTLSRLGRRYPQRGRRRRTFDGQVLAIERGIEVGCRVLGYLGTKYSKAMNATLGENGKPQFLKWAATALVPPAGSGHREP
jgi:prolyl-tRNA synthetase